MIPARRTPLPRPAAAALDPGPPEPYTYAGMPPGSVWAVLTGQVANTNRYSWATVNEGDTAAFSADLASDYAPSGVASATQVINQAYEINGNISVPCDGTARVRLWPGGDGTYWLFSYPGPSVSTGEQTPPSLVPDVDPGQVPALTLEGDLFGTPLFVTEYPLNGYPAVQVTLTQPPGPAAPTQPVLQITQSYTVTGQPQVTFSALNALTGGQGFTFTLALVNPPVPYSLVQPLLELLDGNLFSLCQAIADGNNLFGIFSDPGDGQILFTICQQLVPYTTSTTVQQPYVPSTTFQPPPPLNLLPGLLDQLQEVIDDNLFTIDPTGTISQQIEAVQTVLQQTPFPAPTPTSLTQTVVLPDPVTLLPATSTVVYQVAAGVVEAVGTNLTLAGSLASGGGAVTSVAGRTGAVTLTTSDIGGLGSAALQSASAFQPACAGLTSLCTEAASNTGILYLSAEDTFGALTIGTGLSLTGGTLAATGGGTGTEVSVTATGTNAATAAPVTTATTVTSATATGSDGTGVILPDGITAAVVTVYNANGSGSLNVYPPSGASFITGFGAVSSVSLSPGSIQTFTRISSTVWN